MRWVSDPLLAQPSPKFCTPFIPQHPGRFWQRDSCEFCQMLRNKGVRQKLEGLLAKSSAARLYSVASGQIGHKTQHALCESCKMLRNKGVRQKLSHTPRAFLAHAGKLKGFRTSCATPYLFPRWTPTLMKQRANSRMREVRRARVPEGGAWPPVKSTTVGSESPHSASTKAFSVASRPSAITNALQFRTQGLFDYLRRGFSKSRAVESKRGRKFCKIHTQGLFDYLLHGFCGRSWMLHVICKIHTQLKFVPEKTGSTKAAANPHTRFI